MKEWTKYPTNLSKLIWSNEHIRFEDRGQLYDDLIKMLDESRIHFNLISQLELNSDLSINNSVRIAGTPNSILHWTILNMKSFPHRKGKRYTREQLVELGQILRRFPDDHMTICRALKIPKSTFYMLKRSCIKKTFNINCRSGYQKSSILSPRPKRSISLR